LLAFNTSSLTTLSSLELLLRERKPFTLDAAVTLAETLIGAVGGIVAALNAMCGGRYGELEGVVGRIGSGVLAGLTRPRVFKRRQFVMPLESLDRGMVEDIGGKAANYGEIANKAGLPVSPGFAVTAHACNCFLEESGLKLAIRNLLKDLDVSDTPQLNQVSGAIMEMVLAAPLPPGLEAALNEAAARLPESKGEGLRMSVRSSASSEDSEASFAGQYASVLNVLPDGLPGAYREVVASTFTPRAIYYRRTKGYTEDDVIMSVLCLVMVDARASGVMYTADPTGGTGGEIVVSAAWGLGVSVVDGSASVDIYRIAKEDGRVVFQEIGRKTERVVMAADLGLTHEAVSPDMQGLPCLAGEELAKLAGYGLRLEAHYGQTLDIEWAMEQDGKLIILQARPLNPMSHEPEAEAAPAGEEATAIDDGALFLEGGHCASPGVACGQAHVLVSEQELQRVPENAILVAPQTSPSFVSIMGRLQGIITELGSVTGHMAAVAREYELPALVAVDNATSLIQSGWEITMDAAGRRLYRGRIETLLSRKKRVNPMAGSPVHNAVRLAMDSIAPLNLVDPRAPEFRPGGCRTLHDVIRFAHEISMNEMFQISESLDEDEGGAVRLKAPLPMIIYCVDLGGGLGVAPGNRTAAMRDLISEPFSALMRGMTHKNVRWAGAVGMSMGGFVSLMAHSAMNDPSAEGRFGGANYAVISKEYANFNARLGYHFAVVDAYCGTNIDENYITFSFKGGAATVERKGRRVKLIAAILERLGFRVQSQGDMVRGELKEGKAHQIAEKLDQIGRLLGAMRLLDMAINSDSEIPWYADEFFKGNYTFEKSEGKSAAVA
jgi:pyruvate,water dikinase